MKDSGIEWIGEIPEEWEVVPARYFFKANKKIVGRKENEYERLSLTMKGVLKKSKYNSEGLQPSNFNSYQILTKNQIVFKLIDLQNVSTSRVGISPYKGIVSPAYIIIDRKDTKTNNRFYYYWYMSMYLNKVFNLLGDAGVRSNINATELLELKVPRTSFREQNIISNFLDKKTEQIEDIKSTIMKGIQILEDYKKSVITEAVTKGLDKNVEMKDSGVEWIGEIPKHWSVSRIKYLTTSRSEKGNLSDTNKYIGLENVESKTGKYIKTDTDYIDAVYDQCKKGDLLYGKLRPNLNKVLISPFDASCTGEFEIIKESTIDKKWLYYYFLTPGFTNIVNSSTFGAKMPRASWDFIGNIKIAYPNDSEMQEIVSYIEFITSATDIAICSKQKQLEVLEEYKKSLIYEYVTGKKEVL